MKTMNRILAVMLLCAALLPAAVAQAETLMIRGASVHTMTGDGTLKDTDVLVEDGKIARIGKGLRAPKGTRVFEAAGQPLTPGLFAGANSIGITEVSGVEESVDNGLALTQMRPEFDVVPAYNPHSSLVPITRIEGFSFTLLNAGAKGTIFGGQGRMVALDGGFESFIGEPVLYINVGSDVSSLSGGSRAGQWMLLHQAMKEADTPPVSTETAVLTRAGRGTLSLFADGGRVVFEVDRAADILETLRFAGKYGFKPVISSGTEAWMVAAQLAAADVPVMLNPLANLPSSFDSLGAREDNAALLHAAGVTVIINGDGSHNARKQRQMAGNAVAYGLPHAAGLAALTSHPARVFGVSGQQGSIAPGMPANLALWDGDPLEVTSAAEIVIINGKLMPMESRQTRLRDRYLPENPALPRAYIKP